MGKEHSPARCSTMPHVHRWPGHGGTACGTALPAPGTHAGEMPAACCSLHYRRGILTAIL